jgi:hypothetical protein
MNTEQKYIGKHKIPVTDTVKMMELARYASCKFYGLSELQFHSRNRAGNLPRVRFLFYFICSKFFERYISQTQMGAFVGGYDHSTAYHGVKSINELIQTDRRYRKDIESFLSDFKVMIDSDLNIRAIGEIALQDKIKNQKEQIDRMQSSFYSVVNKYVAKEVSQEAINKFIQLNRSVFFNQHKEENE